LIFGGFLLNPIDGYSYLAKMQIGRMGEWTFKLLYSPPGGNGAFIFLFYIALGHISRITGLSPILVFHCGRLIASILLLIALYRLCSWAIQDRAVAFRAWLLASLGSGLGWMAFPIVGLTSDLWVAEAYPWLSMFSSPHFTLALAITCWVIPLIGTRVTVKQVILLGVLGLLEAGLMPFAVVTLGVVAGATVIWKFMVTKEIFWRAILAFFIPALVYLGYQYIAIINDPMLAEWNRQNITDAPPWWDFIIAFSPALVLALVMVVKNSETGGRDENKVFVLWIILGAIIVYIPFALQRRFMFGYYIPTALMAMMLLSKYKGYRRLSFLLILSSTLTNIVLLALFTFGILNHNEKYYFTHEEGEFLACIHLVSVEDDVIAAPEALGLLIPAFSGRHVMLGHPMESVNSTDIQEKIQTYYNGETTISVLENACSCEIDFVVIPANALGLIGEGISADDYVCKSSEYFLFDIKQ
jgi:hypothetical protein